MKIRTILAAAAIAVAGQSAIAQNLGEWRTIRPQEIVVNIVDLPQADVVMAQQRTRDKHAIQQFAVMGDLEAWIRLQSSFSPGRVIKEHDAAAFGDSDGAKKLARDVWRQRGEPFDYEESQKIYAFGERLGRAHMTRGRRTGQRCIIAELVFLSDQAKATWHTSEVYDTSVSFWDCSGKRSFALDLEWLESLKIVPPEYNRFPN